MSATWLSTANAQRCSRSLAPMPAPCRFLPRIVSREPAREIGAHEVVVGEVRIAPADAVELRRLPGAEALVGVEAPDAIEQALAAQDLVAAGDDAVEVVGGVEDRSV